MSFDGGAECTIRRADMPWMRANGLSMMLEEREVDPDPQGMANLLAYQRTLRERSVRHGHPISCTSRRARREHRETRPRGLASVRRLNEVVKVGDRPQPGDFYALAASFFGQEPGSRPSPARPDRSRERNWACAAPSTMISSFGSVVFA